MNRIPDSLPAPGSGRRFAARIGAGRRTISSDNGHDGDESNLSKDAANCR